MNIGNSIKLVRSIAGLTQEGMAQRLGITSNYLSLVENQKATPSLALVEKIEQEFDVPASFLLWNARFHTRQHDPEIADRYRKLGEQITELVTTIIRRKMEPS
jgi:transcriptional regulator with XRE-family HTH domain